MPRGHVHSRRAGVIMSDYPLSGDYVGRRNHTNADAEMRFFAECSRDENVRNLLNRNDLFHGMMAKSLLSADVRPLLQSPIILGDVIGKVRQRRRGGDIPPLRS